EFIYKSLKREVPRDMLISHISRVHASNSKDSIGKILFSVCIPETCACEFFELICLPEGHIKIQEQSDRDH
ncbi:MAG: hypothetical protein MRY83_16495, partial [Flavobacteriales bacterium]|nr:hypothetical protein [Flavobacteriales bacterium]